MSTSCPTKQSMFEGWFTVVLFSIFNSYLLICAYPFLYIIYLFLSFILSFFKTIYIGPFHPSGLNLYFCRYFSFLLSFFPFFLLFQSVLLCKLSIKSTSLNNNKRSKERKKNLPSFLQFCCLKWLCWWTVYLDKWFIPFFLSSHNQTMAVVSRQYFIALV